MGSRRETRHPGVDSWQWARGWAAGDPREGDWGQTFIPSAARERRPLVPFHPARRGLGVRFRLFIVLGAIAWPAPKSFCENRKAPLIWGTRNNSKLQKMSVYVTLREPERVDFFVYQFSHLQNGDNDSTCVRL